MLTLVTDQFFAYQSVGFAKAYEIRRAIEEASVLAEVRRFYTNRERSWLKDRYITRLAAATPISFWERV